MKKRNLGPLVNDIHIQLWGVVSPLLSGVICASIWDHLDAIPATTIIIVIGENIVHQSKSACLPPRKQKL